MKVLVTGGTGFLGTNLVRRLLADGTAVRMLVRSPAKAAPLVEEGAEAVIGEITERDILKSALQGIDIVYHLAGKLHVPGVPDAEYYRTHVEGTRMLLACCGERSGLKRLVYASASGVIGPTGDIPAREDAPCAPRNVYEQTKLEAEMLVGEAVERGLPAAIVRPALVYGPGDLHLLGFFRAIQRGLFRPIGSRPVRLHPIYVDDLTEAFICCSQHPRAVGECYHIAGREPVTTAALSSTIAKALGVKAPRGNIPLPVARTVAAFGDLLPDRLKPLAPLNRGRLQFLTISRVYDITKASQSLGFTAGTDLSKGIERTVAWYRQMGHLPAGR